MVDGTAECDLCGGEDVLTPTDVREEGSDATMTVDLCEDCRDKAIRHGRGEDVHWEEVSA